MIESDLAVCVVIPAWNAGSTIGRAVRSALVQPDVGEVVVVDDASTDGTAAVASASCDGSGRLRVITQPRNGGPSAARNLAIAASRAPVIALLDSDDFFLPARFGPLLAIPGWDLIADNLVFIGDHAVATFDAKAVAEFDAAPERLDLASFIDGNVSRPGQPRAELGFAKPLIRRDFLARHGLAYDETLRLGEDFALYMRALARGGAFLRVRRCGYVAVERANSLSGRHATSDLAALLASDRRFAAEASLAPAESAALARHIDQLAHKVRHRAFLDAKRDHGLGRALVDALAEPAALPGLAAAIIRDKLSALVAGPAAPTLEARYLFS